MNAVFSLYSITQTTKMSNISLTILSRSSKPSHIFPLNLDLKESSTLLELKKAIHLKHKKVCIGLYN